MEEDFFFCKFFKPIIWLVADLMYHWEHYLMRFYSVDIRMCSVASQCHHPPTLKSFTSSHSSSLCKMSDKELPPVLRVAGGGQRWWGLNTERCSVLLCCSLRWHTLKRVSAASCLSGILWPVYNWWAEWIRDEFVTVNQPDEDGQSSGWARLIWLMMMTVMTMMIIQCFLPTTVTWTQAELHITITIVFFWMATSRQWGKKG